jgi:hypothetical protein
MLRSTFAGLVTLGLIAGAVAAQAQGKMDCGAAYKGFMANVHRLALRAYDACQAGDEFNARQLFDDLAKSAR